MMNVDRLKKLVITVCDPGLKEVAQFEEVVKLGIIALFHNMKINMEELDEAVVEYRELVEKYREERALLDGDRDNLMYQYYDRCLKFLEGDDRILAMERAYEEVMKYNQDTDLLIREDCFVDHVQTMTCADKSFMAGFPGYIINNINWEGVANDFRSDYREVMIIDQIYFYDAQNDVVNFYDMVVENIQFLYTLEQYYAEAERLDTFVYTHRRDEDGHTKKTNYFITRIKDGVVKHFWQRIDPRILPRKELTHDQFKVAYHNWCLQRMWEYGRYECAWKFVFIEEEWIGK